MEKQAKEVPPGNHTAHQKAGGLKHVLPPLPYGYAALEPHIDTRTMTLHHDKHHATYVTALNAALEKLPDLQGRTAIWLLLNSERIPEASRTAVHNNAGGHVNHSLFWRTMSPGIRRPAHGPSGRGDQTRFWQRRPVQDPIRRSGCQAVRVRLGLAGENPGRGEARGVHHARP